MVHYRRSRVAGGTFFFTVALRDRLSNMLVEHVNALRNSLALERSRRPFGIDAMVILPDHLHAVWTLPEGDSDYSSRWKSIKSRFVRSLRTQGVALATNAKGEVELWQRRFWEHQIRDETDFKHHVDYVHINPVKHGHVRRASDWPWSTFHRFVRQGILEASWASTPDSPGKYGE